MWKTWQRTLLDNWLICWVHVWRWGQFTSATTRLSTKAAAKGILRSHIFLLLNANDFWPNSQQCYRSAYVLPSICLRLWKCIRTSCWHTVWSCLVWKQRIYKVSCITTGQSNNHWKLRKLPIQSKLQPANRQWWVENEVTCDISGVTLSFDPIKLFFNRNN